MADGELPQAESFLKEIGAKFAISYCLTIRITANLMQKNPLVCNKIRLPPKVRTLAAHAECLNRTIDGLNIRENIFTLAWGSCPPAEISRLRRVTAPAGDSQINLRRLVVARLVVR